jgi:hypothetical protein
MLNTAVYLLVAFRSVALLCILNAVSSFTIYKYRDKLIDKIIFTILAIVTIVLAIFYEYMIYK